MTKHSHAVYMLLMKSSSKRASKAKDSQNSSFSEMNTLNMTQTELSHGAGLQVSEKWDSSVIN